VYGGEFFDNRPTLFGRKRSPSFERDRVVVYGKVLDLGNECLRIRMRLGQLVVIPRGGGISNTAADNDFVAAATAVFQMPIAEGSPRERISPREGCACVKTSRPTWFDFNYSKHTRP
jgi:hypothetical protein